MALAGLVVSAVTGEALRHTAGPMRASTFLIQPPHDRLVPQHRPGRDPGSELVTGRAGTGAGCAKDKFTVGVSPRSVGNLSERPAMFRVTGRAGRSLRYQLAVPGCHGGRRPILEILLRMTDDAARRSGTAEWFVAVGASGLIDVVSTQLSGSPECSGTSYRPPDDPHDKHKRRQGHHRHRSFWQRMVSHPSRNSREEQRTRHMQHRQHEKHQRHRRVDRLPDAERFLLRSHSMQLRIDIMVG